MKRFSEDVSGSSRGKLCVSYPCLPDTLLIYIANTRYQDSSSHTQTRFIGFVPEPRRTTIRRQCWKRLERERAKMRSLTWLSFKGSRRRKDEKKLQWTFCSYSLSIVASPKQLRSGWQRKRGSSWEDVIIVSSHIIKARPSSYRRSESRS